MSYPTVEVNTAVGVRQLATGARGASLLFRLLRSTSPADVWLLPANVCAVVPLTFRAAARRFQFVDIDADLAASRATCLARVGEDRSVAGVLFVRPYGHVGDERGFFAALHRLRPELLVIDDRCLCVPDPDDSSLDPEADLTLFSTGRAKVVDLSSESPLPGVGGGFAFLKPGARLSSEGRAYDRATELAVDARLRAAQAGAGTFVGGDEPWLDVGPAPWDWATYRERIARRSAAEQAMRAEIREAYRGLPAACRLPPSYDDWRVQIRVPAPDLLVADLFAAGLWASRHYPPPTGVWVSEPFPRTAALYGEVVNLFADPAYGTERALATCRIVRRHLGRLGRG